MRMSTLLFLLIGLAVGLYLGFNPAAHRDIVRWWNREAVSQAGGSQALFTIRGLNSHLNRSLRSSPRPLAQPGAQQTNVPSSGQIGAELHAFWLALERIWLNLLAELHIRT